MKFSVFFCKRVIVAAGDLNTSLALLVIPDVCLKLHFLVPLDSCAYGASRIFSCQASSLQYPRQGTLVDKRMQLLVDFLDAFYSFSISFKEGMEAKANQENYRQDFWSCNKTCWKSYPDIRRFIHCWIFQRFCNIQSLCFVTALMEILIAINLHITLLVLFPLFRLSCRVFEFRILTCGIILKGSVPQTFVLCSYFFHTFKQVLQHS